MFHCVNWCFIIHSLEHRLTVEFDLIPFCSIHFCVTYLNTQPGVAELFLKDVRECCAKLLNDPLAKTEGMVCC